MVVLSYEVIFAIQVFSHRELTKNSVWKVVVIALPFVHEDLSAEVIDTFIIFQKGLEKRYLGLKIVVSVTFPRKRILKKLQKYRVSTDTGKPQEMRLIFQIKKRELRLSYG